MATRAIPYGDLLAPREGKPDADVILDKHIRALPHVFLYLGLLGAALQRDPIAILVAILPAVTACLPAHVAVGGPKQADPFDSVTSCAPQEPATSLHTVVLGPSGIGKSVVSRFVQSAVQSVLAEAHLHTSSTVPALLHQFKDAKGVVYTNADEMFSMLSGFFGCVGRVAGRDSGGAGGGGVSVSDASQLLTLMGGNTALRRQLTEAAKCFSLPSVNWSASFFSQPSVWQHQLQGPGPVLDGSIARPALVVLMR
jgi:hypothetical protein